MSNRAELPIANRPAIIESGGMNLSEGISTTCGKVTRGAEDSYGFAPPYSRRSPRKAKLPADPIQVKFLVAIVVAFLPVLLIC